jgi:hypothetical protein
MGRLLAVLVPSRTIFLLHVPMNDMKNIQMTENGQDHKTFTLRHPQSCSQTPIASHPTSISHVPNLKMSHIRELSHSPVQSTSDAPLPPPTTSRTPQPRSRTASLLRATRSSRLSSPKPSVASPSVSENDIPGSPAEVYDQKSEWSAIVGHSGQNNATVIAEDINGKGKGRAIDPKPSLEINDPGEQIAERIETDTLPAQSSPPVDTHLEREKREFDERDENLSPRKVRRVEPSTSLAKILNPTNVDAYTPITLYSSLSSPSSPIASSSASRRSAALPRVPAPSPTSYGSLEPEPLSNYSCPICFSPPMNATLTPCGHICCGPCLFMAVKSTMKRSQTMMADAVPRWVSLFLCSVFVESRLQLKCSSCGRRRCCSRLPFQLGMFS